ncbi:MAG: hypothetical protein H0U27_04485, partial [Nitrosopumilus sp.]|nr:hypothetical protein [Nitrosopumilus sp.]
MLINIDSPLGLKYSPIHLTGDGTYSLNVQCSLSAQDFESQPNQQVLFIVEKLVNMDIFENPKIYGHVAQYYDSVSRRNNFQWVTCDSYNVPLLTPMQPSIYISSFVDTQFKKSVTRMMFSSAQRSHDVKFAFYTNSYEQILGPYPVYRLLCYLYVNGTPSNLGLPVYKHIFGTYTNNVNVSTVINGYDNYFKCHPVFIHKSDNIAKLHSFLHDLSSKSNYKPPVLPPYLPVIEQPPVIT